MLVLCSFCTCFREHYWMGSFLLFQNSKLHSKHNAVPSTILLWVVLASLLMLMCLLDPPPLSESHWMYANYFMPKPNPHELLAHWKLCPFMVLYFLEKSFNFACVWAKKHLICVIDIGNMNYARDSRPWCEWLPIIDVDPTVSMARNLWVVYMHGQLAQAFLLYVFCRCIWWFWHNPWCSLILEHIPYSVTVDYLIVRFLAEHSVFIH